MVQLILLPIEKPSFVKYRQLKREQNKTTKREIYFIQEVTKNRPICFIKINGKYIEDLIDTGANVSVVTLEQWPATWLTSLIGLGTLSTFYRVLHLCLMRD